jgi:gas vesicle protein
MKKIVITCLMLSFIFISCQEEKKEKLIDVKINKKKVEEIKKEVKETAEEIKEEAEELKKEIKE